MGFKFNATTGELDLVNKSKDSSVVSLTAGETISALKLVYQDIDSAFVASSNLDQRPIGIALNSANIGDPVRVRTFGELKDVSFSYSANQTLFLSSNGSLTTTSPSTGYSVEVGYGQGSGEIFINIKTQIVL
jgi:hypothetical protein